MRQQAMAVLVWLGLIIIGCSGPALTAKPIVVGYVGVIAGARPVTGGLLKEQLDPNSHLGVPNVLVGPKIRLKVLAIDGSSVQVEVLEGDAKGLKPWLHIADIK
jgi:hypothetical protein